MFDFTEEDRLKVNDAIQDHSERLILASAPIAEEIQRKYKLSNIHTHVAVANAFLGIGHLMIAKVYQLDEADLAEKINRVIKDALRRTPWRE